MRRRESDGSVMHPAASASICLSSKCIRRRPLPFACRPNASGGVRFHLPVVQMHPAASASICLSSKRIRRRPLPFACRPNASWLRPLPLMRAALARPFGPPRGQRPFHRPDRTGMQPHRQAADPTGTEACCFVGKSLTRPLGTLSRAIKGRVGEGSGRVGCKREPPPPPGLPLEGGVKLILLCHIDTLSPSPP